MGTPAVTAERPTFSVTSIRDYQNCPRGFYFARVLKLERETTHIAALFGIAIHDAIANWHTLKQSYGADQVIADYAQKLLKEIAKAQGRGLEIGSYEGDTTIAKFALVAHEILTGYVADPRNAVDLIVNEYFFEVEIQSSTKKTYRFVGYIDQVRKHPDDSLHVIDLKTGKTKPSDHLLTLDEQLSLYAIACVKGRFRAHKDAPWFTIGQRPATLQLAMVRDYGVRARNEFAEFIKHPDKLKVKNPKTGCMVIQEIPNPKFQNGYKKGDVKGPVFFRTLRSNFDLRQAEIDLARVCGAIRLKQFFRRPSQQVCGFCKFQKPCVEERAEPI